jgi:hypothetical protein
MKAAFVASVMAASLLASTAGAYEYGSVQGNDTGGIIPWSCETEMVAQDMAGNHCGNFGKYARITSVTRQYGDFIAFACLWNPYIAPYQIPATRVRTACHSAPTRRIWVPRDDAGNSE